MFALPLCICSEIEKIVKRMTQILLAAEYWQTPSITVPVSQTVPTLSYVSVESTPFGE